MFIRYDVNGQILERVDLYGPDFVTWVENNPELNYVEMEINFDVRNLMTDYYVDTNTKTLIKRPVMTLPDLIELKIGDEYVIDNLPNTCQVRIDNQDCLDVTDGVLCISADIEDEYVITITSWPYIQSTIKVRATS